MEKQNLEENNKYSSGDKNTVKKAEISHVLQQNFAMTAGITSDLLEKISHIDLENDYYSQGFQSKVYKVDVDTPSGLKHFLILKKRLGDKESGNSIIQEYDFHSRSKDLLRKRPDLAKHIDVPTVWSILNDTQGNYFLIMDYIEGKTIFAHNVGATIPIVYKELQVKLGDTLNNMIEPYEEILATGSDYMLKKYAIKLFRIFCRYAQETKYEKYFMLVQESDFSELRDGKALEEKINRIATKIYSSYVNSDVNHVRKEEKKDSALETIKYLHENAIYHNDITSRNVILGDDGKVYILDFGNASSEAKKESNLKASMTSPSNKKHETYKGKVLEKDYRIISMIDKL